jgi:hypothetical protein
MTSPATPQDEPEVSAADIAGLSAFGLGPAPAGGALERARGLAEAVARRRPCSST